MASTYTLNNGIELIGTGEQSGTWGDTTNTNLELLDTALDGQVTVTLTAAGNSGSPNTLPIADGSDTNSEGRNRMVIFNDGSDLGATAYVQLTPNDAEKIIYIRNDLSGSRSIILFQGTYNASNDYEVPAGTTAVIYFDGAGSGAVAANVFNNAYFDSLRLGSVSVTAILDEDNMASDSATALATQQSIKAYVDTQVGANNELSEVLANGNTSGGTGLIMSSGDDMTLTGASYNVTWDSSDNLMRFASNASAVFGGSATDYLQIYSDGTNKYIQDVGSGSLFIRGSDLVLEDASGNDYIAMSDTGTGGTVELKHSAVTKLTTTSTGIDVTGTAVTDGLTVAGDTTLRNATFSDTTDSNTQVAVVGGSQILYIQAGSAYSGVLLSSNTYVPQEYRTNQNDIKFSYDNGTTANLLLDYSAQQISTTGIGFTFNEGGGDYDFRVESNSRSNALVLDGGTGNLALNTTNSDFYTGFDTTSIKLGPVASMWSLSNGSSDRRMTIDQNLYVNTDGTNRYLTTGAAARYQMNTGTHRFETAPSGSDDATASDLAVQMLILNSGDVRMGLDNSTAQELNFRTSSSAGRKIRKRIKRGDSGATNAMVQMDMLGSGTNGYIGQMNMYMTPSDVYNSAQIDVFSLYATTGAIFNEDSTSYNDFRVESDNYSHMLFLDASYDHVSIGRTGTANNYNGLFQVGSNISGTVFTSTTAVVSNPTTMASAAGSAYRILQLAQNTGNSTALSFSGIRESTGSTFETAAFEVTLDVDNTNNVRRFQKWSYPQGNVFNDSSGDIDFRVESNNNTHMLFVDAGNDRTGINTSSPAFDFDVNGQTRIYGADNGILVLDETNGVAGGAQSTYVSFRANNTQTAYTGVASSGGIYYVANKYGSIQLMTGPSGTESSRLLLEESSGAIFNEDSNDYDFRVESNSNSNAIFLDAGTERLGIFTSTTDNATNYSNQLCGNVALGTYSQSVATIATSSSQSVDIPYSRLSRGVYEFAFFGFQDGGATQAGCVVHLYCMTNPDDHSRNDVTTRGVTVSTSNNSGNLRVTITNSSSVYSINSGRYCVRRMC